MKELSTRGKLVAVLLSLSTMFGCGALEAGQPGVQSSTGLVATSPVLNFGTVPVGTTGVLTNTVINNTKSPITLTRAQVDQADFQITSPKLPLTLAAGQRTALQIAYSPQSSGSSQGRVVLTSNVTRFTSTFTMKGTATISSRIRLDPASISFGNVQTGKTQTHAATLTNPGRMAVTIARIAVSGTEFALSGLTLPMTLQGGQSAPVSVNFTPASNGAVTGTISLIGTISMNRPKRRPTPFGGRGSETVVALTTWPTALNVPVSGTGMGSGQLVVSPASLALGKVRIGASQTLSATLINSGSMNVTVRNVTVSGRGFRMSGITFPLTLAAGQRKAFAVTFTPQAAGSSSGSLAVTSDAANSVVSVPVSATATDLGILVSNPSSLGFGSVQVGHGQTLSETLTNSGSASVTVSQANVSGSGLTITGLNLPLTLAAGQSTAFSVSFNPKSGGSVSGVLTIASDAADSGLTVSIAANGVTAGALTSAPASLSFGSVQTSNPKTIAETLTNSGGSSISITQANLTGAGFTLSGLTLPITLSAGQSKTFNVTFTPQAGRSTNGSLSIASNASNPTLGIPLVANSAPAPGVLSTSDSSLTFGSVQVAGSATQSETLTNTGASSVTVTQATVSGTGFRITGLSLPMTLSPGQSFTFGTVFTPTSGGSKTGSISVVSDASDSTLTISLAGTAAVSGQLAVSPATLSFGNVTVGQTKSLTATLTASGSSITVSDAGMSTSEFKVSGLSLPLTLAAGQSASFTVSFTPQSSGTASASGSFTSNASNSSTVQALTGNGAAAPQHSVALSWTASTSSVVGYNVYRSTTGGSYSKISALNASTSYTDHSVQAGQTYTYVTTAVDGSGKESANSNQALAVIPTP